MSVPAALRLTSASALTRAVDLPITTKIRLCDNAEDTKELATRLARAGSAAVTLHARHVAPNRRRGRPAKLEYVRAIVEAFERDGLRSRTAVVSNGNVRGWGDVQANLAYTGADGVMVGEPLLCMPECVGDAKRADGSLFAPNLSHTMREHVLPTFLGMSRKYPIDTTLHQIKQHTQYMLRTMFPPGRETRTFADALLGADDVAAMESLARQYTMSLYKSA